MSCYVNPPNETKEEFLLREGREIKAADAVIKNDEYPVCLLTYATYTAAGIAHDEEMLKKLSDPYNVVTASAVWYMVPKASLIKVSDLEEWL